MIDQADEKRQFYTPTENGRKLIRREKLKSWIKARKISRDVKLSTKLLEMLLKLISDLGLARNIQGNFSQIKLKYMGSKDFKVESDLLMFEANK